MVRGYQARAKESWFAPIIHWGGFFKNSNIIAIT